MTWTWEQIEPHYAALAARDVNAANVNEWLTDWSRLTDLMDESEKRLYIATTLDTADKTGEARFHAFLENILEQRAPHEQKLRQKLLDTGLEPEGFAVPLRSIRADAKRFVEANVPLFTQEHKLISEYNRVTGGQTVQWEGRELTVAQMRPVYQHPDRGARERAWRLTGERQLADRETLSDLWGRFMTVRGQIAANAGFGDYRAFRWSLLHRFDYTPEDCLRFHDAIEKAVVPAATRLYEKRRQQLGLATLRPWDLDVDPLGRPALRPFAQVDDLESKCETIFREVDEQLGDYFAIMRREKLLDLENRRGKAPGGYQEDLPAAKRPFIFMNAVGMHGDVQTLLHEGGHAFHCFSTVNLPYSEQRKFSTEIAEVASMSMELLAAPYLTAAHGGYYDEAQAARARIEHLEEIILFWPYMAVVDAFQHWAYTHPDAARQSANCDAQWTALITRFMPGIDWSGLEDVKATGWQRRLHIFEVPFYYVDYGLAEMGAVQVWRNSLADEQDAVAQYKYMLTLGNTRTLPELYQAAGAKLAFDAATLDELVMLIEKTLGELEVV
jgi:oligoendopeptidase F